MSTQPARPVVILNRGAGTARRVDAALLDRLKDAADVLESEGPEQARELASSVPSGARRIIVAGGDGSINGVLNGLERRLGDVELGILPVGTGNDLARAVGIPLDDLDAALTLALDGPASPVDVVRATGSGESRLFINMCYGGFGDRLVDRVSPDSKARLGFAAFWLAAARQMLNLPDYVVSLRTAGQEFSSTLHGVLVANSRFLGGGVAAAPSARLDDGQFDVTLLPAGSVWDVLAASVALISGTIDESNRVANFRARDLEVRSEPAMSFTMDGEAAPDGLTRFESMPGALRLVMAHEPSSFTATS